MTKQMAAQGKKCGQVSGSTQQHEGLCYRCSSGDKKAEMCTTEVHQFNEFSCIANILGISLVVAHSFFL